MGGYSELIILIGLDAFRFSFQLLLVFFYNGVDYSEVGYDDAFRFFFKLSFNGAGLTHLGRKIYIWGTNY